MNRCHSSDQCASTSVCAHDIRSKFDEMFQRLIEGRGDPIRLAPGNETREIESREARGSAQRAERVDGIKERLKPVALSKKARGKSKSVSKGPIWTASDRDLFLSAYKAHVSGTKRKKLFALIAQQIPGKTAEQVNHYFYNNKERLGLSDTNCGVSQASGGASCDTTCLICLEDFSSSRQHRSTLHCGHKFHSKCLRLWFKKQNTCPLCRTRISTLNGKEVKENQQQQEYDNYYDVVVCETCGSGENEQEIILCDRCDRGFHMSCLDPPLAEIPQGEWFCPNCV